MRAEIKFQQLVLEPFLNRLCMQSLKENKFWREFEAKEEVQVRARTKQESFLKIF